VTKGFKSQSPRQKCRNPLHEYCRYETVFSGRHCHITECRYCNDFKIHAHIKWDSEKINEDLTEYLKRKENRQTETFI